MSPWGLLIGMTLKRIVNGQRCACQPKRRGKRRRGELTVDGIRGVIRGTPVWSPVLRARSDEHAPIEWVQTQEVQVHMARLTWPETCGSGAPTGTTRHTSRLAHLGILKVRQLVRLAYSAAARGTGEMRLTAVRPVESGASLTQRASMQDSGVPQTDKHHCQAALIRWNSGSVTSESDHLQRREVIAP